jgi:hypothetical protein
LLKAVTGESDEAPDVDKASSMPQLVMPSIAVPARRPFTERGKRMGRLKVMVVGPDGAGKTSLIHNIIRLCEDIVHVDPPSAVLSTYQCTENHASTRPYPPWWSDLDNKRMLIRRKSSVEGALERNVCFIEAPSIGQEANVQNVLRYFHAFHQRAAQVDQMTDDELLTLLSGEGGVQMDAVLWLLDPHVPELEGSQKALFERFCHFTNVVPLIGHCDSVSHEALLAHKQRVRDFIEPMAARPFSYQSPDPHMPLDTARPSEPFAVSSALADDAEEVDASILMSSQYLAPLVPSELAYFVDRLLDPENMARMRHMAATKYLLWRRQSKSRGLDLPVRMPIASPQFGATVPSVTSTGSILDEPSKILVPHSTSSYYRSPSPAVSDLSAASGPTTFHAQYNDLHTGEQPFRQIRLAKWARDLQRGLENERRRYHEMYHNTPPEWTSSSSSDDEKALVSMQTPGKRPGRGRLGGDIAIIDPRDPLGVLAFAQAFRRRGWFALQLAGGIGLVGTLAWWAMRNWVEIQEWLGFPTQPVVSAPAVPAPTRGVVAELEGLFGKALGWGR